MRLISKLILLGCLVWLGLMGLTPEVEAVSIASNRFAHWQGFWTEQTGPAAISLGIDPAPPLLPGPSQAEYGSRPHAVKIKLNAPAGDYTLQLRLFDAAKDRPPRLVVKVNGAEAGSVAVPAGKGGTPPYAAFNPALTVELPVTIPDGPAVIEITNAEGSFAAPAQIRLISGTTFSPAKMGYLLLAQKKRYLVPLLLALLAALLLQLWSRATLRAAVATLVVVVVSTGVSLALVEVVFREYLIRVPQARRLAVERGMDQEGAKGTKYNFRMMIQPNPDPRIPYQLRAGLDGSFMGKPVKTNSRHMRGPEVSQVKPSGVLRVAGLGDSVGFGWGVAQGETFIDQLADILTERSGRKVQGLNFSCPSYNTSVEEAVFEHKALAFGPDLAVILFVDNDFDMPSMLLEPVRRWALDRSYLVGQLRRRLAAHWPDAPPESEPVFTSGDRAAAERDAAWLARLKAYYGKGAGPEGVAAAIDDIAATLKANSIAGVLVFYPNRLGPPPERVAKVLAQCGALGIHTVDMGPVIAAYLKENGGGTMAERIWVHPRDPHPNQLGHRLIAEAAARLVIEKGLLRGGR